MTENTEFKDFESFLDLFPEVEMPLTLSSEYVEIFSKYNKPIPEFEIAKYILNEDIYIPDNISVDYEPDHVKGHVHDDHSHNLHLEEMKLDNILGQEQDSQTDDFVEDEYIACLKLPETIGFHALVYVRIGILKYEYILHTYDLKGQTLSTQMIASMTSDGEIIKELVAMIDEDLIILIMEGDASVKDNYNPERSKFLSYEIDDKGYILEYKL